MELRWTKLSGFSKQTIKAFALSSMLIIGACSVNPATGDRQFTGLLPAANEAQIGAQEHSKIEATFGKFMTGDIANYVEGIGQKLAKNTERSDVQYRFFVIDSPIVNAFALPGGYIYVSRGLMTLANSEAELAAVIGHEIGHVTGRHAAERMSHGTLANVGAAVLGTVVGGSAGQAASLGANLYVSSYSRGQEHQSDELGVRYLSRAGYDPMAMADFLQNLDAQSKLDAKEAGKSGSGFNYFSTHPLTADRVQQARAEGAKFPASNVINRDTYLRKINGMTYGDSASQGFVRGNTFYHTEIGFAFDTPSGSKVQNGNTQVGITHSNGSVIVFDAAKDGNNPDPLTFLQRSWLKGENTQNSEAITINGMRAATAAFAGNVQGRAVTVRLVAIEWSPGVFYRFQMAIPNNVGNDFVEQLKKTTYSFRKLSASEKASIQPKKLRVVQASSNMNVDSLSAKMSTQGNKKEQFLVLNGMGANDQIIAGQPYKIVTN